MSDLSWQTVLLMLFGALVIFCGGYLIVEEWIERRRDAKAFRINPMYRVGSDVKDLHS